MQMIEALGGRDGVQGSTDGLHADTDAVADAIARAQTLTKAAGVTLGPITSISENGGYSPPRPMYRMTAMASAPAPTPIAAGEQSVTAGVSITWEIH